jgi:ABC-2 type transport system permease protein
MSTATATAVDAAPATIDMRKQGVPLSRLIKVELRKMIDTRAGFWLVMAMVVISAFITTAMLIWGEKTDLTFGNMFGMMNIPTGVLLPVLAILLVTSEWSQRTGLVTFTLEPRRSRTVTAKLATSLVYAFGAVVVALVFGAIGTLLADLFRGDIVNQWDMTWVGLGNSMLLQMLALLAGFGFAMLIMNSAAAIVLFFALPTVWSILSSIIPWLREHIQPWADFQMTQMPFQSGEAASGDEWARLAVASTIWVVLPVVVGIWRLLRSEVK